MENSFSLRNRKVIDFWWYLIFLLSSLFLVFYLVLLCSCMLNVSGTLAAHSHTNKYRHVLLLMICLRVFKVTRVCCEKWWTFSIFHPPYFGSSDCNFPSSSPSDFTKLHSQVDTMEFQLICSTPLSNFTKPLKTSNSSWSCKASTHPLKNSVVKHRFLRSTENKTKIKIAQIRTKKISHKKRIKRKHKY